MDTDDGDAGPTGGRQDQIVALRGEGQPYGCAPLPDRDRGRQTSGRQVARIGRR